MNFKEQVKAQIVEACGEKSLQILRDEGYNKALEDTEGMFRCLAVDIYITKNIKKEEIKKMFKECFKEIEKLKKKGEKEE